MRRRVEEETCREDDKDRDTQIECVREIERDKRTPKNKKIKKVQRVKETKRAKKIRNCIIFSGEKNPDCKIPLAKVIKILRTKTVSYFILFC